MRIHVHNMQPVVEVMVRGKKMEAPVQLAPAGTGMVSQGTMAPVEGLVDEMEIALRRGELPGQNPDDDNASE